MRESKHNLSGDQPPKLPDRDTDYRDFLLGQIPNLEDGGHARARRPVVVAFIFFNADVLRAMLAAAACLEDSIARAARRAQLRGNVGRNGSEAEDAGLVAAYKAGEQPAATAARHERTIRAIEARLELLGIMTADQPTTANSFTSPSKIRDSDE